MSVFRAPADTGFFRLTFGIVMEPGLAWLSRRHGIENIHPCISGWAVSWLSATPLPNLSHKSHALSSTLSTAKINSKFC